MTEPGRQDLISVCVCTYKRPDLLSRLLEALARQAVTPGFTFEVIVVDNDRERSALDVVEPFKRLNVLAVHYDRESERNISATRNRAVRNASGNLIAFIDDDEWPVTEWLACLHGSLLRTACHGVLGPVVADFPANAPKWLQRGGVVNRRRLRTGERVSLRDARTGNVLLRRELFEGAGPWFDPELGRTGGEDGDFFRRQLAKGRIFVWCDEAIAYEVVPRERWTVTYHVQRYLRSGTLRGETLRSERTVSAFSEMCVNVLLCAVCSVATALLVWAPTHVPVRLAQKAAYCAGVVAAYNGRSLLRLRT